ncbi:ATP-binding cassette domain-containing protein [Geobacillus vulcani]|uniref:ATP-binding cassette domain-containing protein n=1 Tax=Geobacillus vulcani TaxID=135517 RepID=UPI0004DF9C91|nr:ABC transporter ATP-binding protein [Geobacillus vulcani]
MQAKLVVKNLTFSYDKNNIISNLSLTIKSKDRVCIIGDNGSGKSTLLKILSGIIHTDCSIYFEGKPLSNLLEYKKRIAYIPDKPYLYDLMTGKENLKLIENLWDIKDKDNYWKKVYDLCEVFNMSSYLNELVQNYSLGMKHKLFFIAMFARETGLMFLDEPFTALDQKSQNIAINLLKTYSQNGGAILFVSHLKELQYELATRFYEMSNGKLKELEQ